jgi:hypothetical protein
MMSTGSLLIFFYAGSAGANEQDAGHFISHVFKAIDRHSTYLRGDVKALVERFCCNVRGRAAILSGCLVNPEASFCVHVFMGIEGANQPGFWARDGV